MSGQANQRPLDRIPAPLFFIVSALLQYTGAGVATAVFAQISPAATAWWRVIVGGLVLLVLWRPWRIAWTWRSFAVTVLFGLFLAAMNMAFYEAMAYLPMGVVVSIEFLGPVAVAVIRGRGWLIRLAALLALGGIGAIGGWGADLSDADVLRGFLFALAAAAMWAGYLVIGSKLAAVGTGGPSLTVGLLAAGILLAPMMGPAAFAADFTGQLIMQIALVAVFSTALPYSIEQIIMRRLAPSTFALLNALMPATSTVVGGLMLRQIPSLAELIGLVCVSVAVWLAGRSENAAEGK